jgi:hypothetical protein
MMDTLAALENSGFSAWLKGSTSIWAYPSVLTLHTLGLGVLVGANWVLDLRLLGVAPAIPLQALEKLFRAMWLGFWINAVTGVMLFIGDATTKGSTWLFMVKLSLVAVGVVIMVFTRRSVYGRGVESPQASRQARRLAAASLIVWTAAIAAGRYMAYLI